MAEKKLSFSQNVEGLYFVDSECIACDACIIDASPFFEMNLEDSHAFVAKQPTNTREITICDEALENCPVEAIGKS